MASAAPPIQPSAEDALEAARSIATAADYVRCAAQQLDRVPSYFLPDIAELTAGITLDSAADLLRIGQRINADHVVVL